MTVYTVTDAKNIDELATKAGGDTYNVNGGTLTIDQDSRYGTNASTSTTLGNMTLSATLGGSVEVDARKVRIIPFNSGTGNVPAYNTAITRGGSSGKMIGVYSALNVAPTAPGAAMPASGFIKVKQWNDVAYTAGALGGISASATGADRVGWIEIVGDEAGTCTVNRLNLFRTRGDWFELGTTDGTRATTYQIPSNGVSQYHAGVWVETAAASGVYEFYPCAGTRTALLANIATDEVRGRWCWVSTAGLLTFGNDGTNSTGGFIPESGRKIRMPNVFLTNCTTAARTQNALPNAVLATRYEFLGSSGGVFDINFASCGWFLNVNSAFQFNMTNTGVLSNITAIEIGSPMVWDQVGVGQEAANTQTAFNHSLCFAGGTFTNCTFTRAAQVASGTYVVVSSDLSGFTFTNPRFHSLTKAGIATTGSVSLTRLASSSITGAVLGGGRLLMTTCNDVQVLNSVYYDAPSGNTAVAIFPMYAFDIASSCTDIKFDGLTFGGLNLVQPASGILQIGAAGCQRIKLRNIGTYASPLSLGSPRVDDVAWTRVTTTATVTKVGHGFAVNDTLYTVVSSDIGAIVVGAKTITAVPTADTFQFAALNAGAIVGTICYFGTKAANVLVLAASAAANGVEVKRVYASHTRTNLYTTDNSSKNVVLENVFSDYLNAPLVAMLNGFLRNVSGTPPLTAQAAVYGTHWFNGYVCDVAANTAAQSWSRTTTTATITSAGHSLRTGMLISVTASSALTAIPKKVYSVTATTSSTFTIVCLNAGAASGTLTYEVANGRFGIQMNEKTTETASAYTIVSGNPQFTSVGGLVMPTVGDKITFETLEYVIGQGSAFPVFEPIMAGGTINNYLLTYSVDKNDGNGFGPTYTLRRRIATGATWANAGTTITVPDSSIFVVGDRFINATNTGVEHNARVVSINSGTQISVDTPHTAAGTNTALIWTHLPEESALGPETGIKLRVSIETTTAIATAITSLYIQTQSTVVGRGYQYPLDPVDATLLMTGIKTGTEVHVYRASDDVELSGTEATAGSTFTYNYKHTGNDTAIYITVIKVGYQWIRYNNQILTADGLTLPVFQSLDRNYRNP